MRISVIIATSVVIAVLSTGCKYYKLEVPQGNIVTPEMAAKVHVGMTRRQVRFVLGSPLVHDSFHESRWDYFYSHTRLGDSPDETTRLTVVFADDEVVSINRGGKWADAKSEVAADAETLVVREGDKKKKKKGFFRRTWEKVTD